MANSQWWPVLAIRGRDRELSAIGEALDGARSGAGSVLLVEGSAGIGKSRLLAEAEQMARRVEFSVAAACSDAGTAVEMGALTAALCSGPTPVLSRDGGRAVSADDQQRYWRLHDLHGLLVQAAAQRPLLLCLDDLQWADGGTLGALRMLPLWLAELPIAWILAFRDAPAVGELTATMQRHGARRLVIERLDQAAAGQIASDVLGTTPDKPVVELIRRAEGNPFLLIEMLIALGGKESVQTRHQSTTSGTAQLPGHVPGAIVGRMVTLSESAQRTLTVAASLGRSFSVTALSSMLSTSPSSLLLSLDELGRAKLLAEAGIQLRFCHEMTRDAIRRSVPASARRALDRQGVDVLLAEGASPMEVADQLVDCAEPGDDVAITTLQRAASILGHIEPSAAAQFLQAALALAPRPHPLRGALTSQCALLLHAAGRPGEARALTESTTRQTLPAEREAEVRLSVAGMLALSADVRADAGRKALELEGLSPALRARHLAQLTHNLTFGGEPGKARATIIKARQLVSLSGDARAAFGLTIAEAGLAQQQSRFGDALAILHPRRAGTGGEGDDPSIRLAELMMAALLGVLGREVEAQGMIDEGVSAARRDHQAWAVQGFETLAGRFLLRAGRLTEAVALVGKHLGHDPHEHTPMDADALVAFGTVAIHTGDQRMSRRAAELAQAMVRDGNSGVRRHAYWLLALQALAADQLDQAAIAARALGDLCDPTVPLLPVDICSEIQLVRIAVLTNDPGMLGTATAALTRRSPLTRMRSPCEPRRSTQPVWRRATTRSSPRPPTCSPGPGSHSPRPWPLRISAQSGSRRESDRPAARLWSRRGRSTVMSVPSATLVACCAVFARSAFGGSR